MPEKNVKCAPIVNRFGTDTTTMTTDGNESAVPNHHQKATRVSDEPSDRPLSEY